MNKSFVLTLSLLLSLIFSGTIQANERPIYIKAPKGATVKAVARAHGITVQQVLRLNKAVQLRPGHPLLPNEQLNVNPNTAPEWLGMTVWQFSGADRFGPSLIPLYERGLSDSLNRVLRRTALSIIDSLLSETTAEYMRTQVSIQDPKIVELHSSQDSLLVLDNLIFGGSEIRIHRSPKGTIMTRSPVKVWRNGVVCLWKQSDGKQITSQLAAIWDPIRVPGINREYQLVIFLDCRNGATMSYDVTTEPVVEAPAPEPQPEPAPVVEAIPPPTPEPELVVSTPVDTTPAHRYYVSDCVYWLTGEHFRIDQNGQPYDQRHGENAFLGHEHTYWTSPWKRLGLRYRLSEARFNMGSLNARAGDYNFGLVGVPVSNGRLRLDLEAGPWYSAAERGYYQVTEPYPGQWQWNPKKLTVDGFGPYVRAQAIMPLNGYGDARLRTGGLLTEYGGFLTFRPGWLYLRAGSNYQRRNEVTRHIMPDITFPADTMRMQEARVGVAWTLGFLTYASWNHWGYDSDLYDFTRFGPGGGFEWNFLTTTKWRMDGSIIRFRNFDDALWSESGRLVHHRSRDREWRVKLGIVYSPGTRLHGLK